MSNYVLANSWDKPNIQDRLWYAMADADKTTLKANEKISFGDKVWVIETKKMYIMGNDETWHEM